MPRIPTISNFNSNSVGVLNAIRAEASPDYQKVVPEVTQTTESIRAVGVNILSHQSRQNEFVQALVNRIALVLVTSKMYSNPLSVFKKGFIELGETVEEVFVEIAKPYEYKNDNEAVFKRYTPEVQTMFHAMNYRKMYPVTVSHQQLKQAFLSWDGVTDLITRIINSLYSAMSFDEYLMTKYMVCILALQGSITPHKIADFTDSANADDVVTTIKTLSNNFEFMRTDFNVAGVDTFCSKDDQYLMMSSEFSAKIDVNSLAKAFNLDYAKFVGKQILVDGFSFSVGEIARLKILMQDDTSFDETIFDTANTAVLEQVGAILLDKNFFMIFDNLQEARQVEVPTTLAFNEFLHVWKTFSASPFANAVLLTSGDSTITTVTVTPETATMTKNSKLALSVVVAGTGIINQGVVYSITGSVDGKSTVSADGVVTVTADETSTSLTVTATSIQDSTKTDTCTITIA